MNDNKFVKYEKTGNDSKGHPIYEEVNLVEDKIKEVIEGVTFIREALQYKQQSISDLNAMSPHLEKETQLIEIQSKMIQLYESISYINFQ